MMQGTTRPHFACTVLKLAILMVLVPLDPADAQIIQQSGNAAGTLDQALDAMKSTLDTMGGRMGQLAMGLMGTLLVIEFVWRGGKWAITGQSFEEVVQPLAYTIGLATVVWGLSQVIPDTVHWLADTALLVADRAGGGGQTDISASSIITSGLRRVVHWLNQIRVLNPATYFYILTAVVSLIVLAIEVAMLVMVYAEIYLVGLIGIITLGFAGLSQTQDIARSYFMALVGKAFKLMALLVVVRGIHSMSSTIANSTGSGFENAISVLLLQIVGAVLIVVLPGTLERLVGGSGGGTAEATGKYVGRYTASAASTAVRGAASTATRNAPALAKAGGKAASYAAGGINWSSIAKSSSLRTQLTKALGGGGG